MYFFSKISFWSAKMGETSQGNPCTSPLPGLDHRWRNGLWKNHADSVRGLNWTLQWNSACQLERSWPVIQLGHNGYKLSLDEQKPKNKTRILYFISISIIIWYYIMTTFIIVAMFFIFITTSLVLEFRVLHQQHAGQWLPEFVFMFGIRPRIPTYSIATATLSPANVTPRDVKLHVHMTCQLWLEEFLIRLPN